MLCSSSGKVAAGRRGEEEGDGVSLCVFVIFYIPKISRKRYGFERTKKDHRKVDQLGGYDRAGMHVNKNRTDCAVVEKEG